MVVVVALVVVVGGFIVCYFAGGYVVWVAYYLCVVIWCAVCIDLDCGWVL